MVSQSLPPGPEGQGQVLETLLAGLPPERVWLAGPERADPQTRARGRFVPLPRGPMPGPGPVPADLGTRLEARVDALVHAWAAAPPAVVVGCSGGVGDLWVAAQAARRAGAGFLAYLFDDPVHQFPWPAYQDLGRRLRDGWLPTAGAVVVPSAAHRDAFAAGTGVPPCLVPNPLAPWSRARPEPGWPRSPVGPVRIVYTGSVSPAQLDALADLVDALRELGPGFCLEIHSWQSTTVLESLGLDLAVARAYPYQDRRGVREVQAGADVCYLPLGFRTPYPEVIRTACPAKTAEYLGSGTPLLVHAPAEAWVGELVRRADAGWVVDQPGPGGLARALGEIAASPRTRARRVAHALRLADGFAPARSRARLARALSQAAARRGPAPAGQP